MAMGGRGRPGLRGVSELHSQWAVETMGARVWLTVLDLQLLVYDSQKAERE